VLGLLIPGIDNSAHIGGFCAGGLAGAAMARPLSGAATPWARGQLLAGAALAGIVAVLVMRIPAAGYRWHDEVLARQEISEFLRDEAAITGAWQSILEEGQRQGISFEELAGRIDLAVTGRYEESFDQLSRLPANPALPSSPTLEVLRRYAEQRRDASRALAEGLRAHDPQQIRDALEQARRAGQPVQPGGNSAPQGGPR